MDWATGNYLLEVTYQQNGKTLRQSAVIRLRDAKFDTETLTISQQKQQEGATDTTALLRENRLLGAAFRERKNGSYVTGAFGHPLRNTQAPITSPYGVQRHYRDQAGRPLYSWSHRGMDFAAKRRTPVYAVQNGVISVAEMMQVNGGIIVLDHGQGVMSIYSHLDALLVQKNQYVTKNALIAYSGNTGQSTGPHLHFGLSVHNVRVNPQEWLGKKW
ncbi:peptidase M23 [Candidatus Termititenax persephonae]|uniref:Peptidase M23 n=1 Tax=Candidatus Termititenax persephonae TaxID=2218525 RepID=A0A388TEB8_9BACT|nr:peptidase M23 [Candidatus Termititenax persephonae]